MRTKEELDRLRERAIALRREGKSRREIQAILGFIGRSTLNKFQSIRHQIADMRTRLEAAAQLNYSVFHRWLRDENVTRDICMIKLFSYQTAQAVVGNCLQLHGGLGYMRDHWCSRFYRDACALTIAAGTPEIMKEMIAAYLRL